MIHNDWTKQMRSKLSNRKVSVPDDLWEKIEARLDNNSTCGADASHIHDTVTASATKRRTWRIVAWSMSAAAAIALLVIGGLRLNEDAIRHADNFTAQCNHINTLATEHADMASAEGNGAMVAIVARHDTAGHKPDNTCTYDSIVRTRCETPPADIQTIKPQPAEDKETNEVRNNGKKQETKTGKHTLPKPLAAYSSTRDAYNATHMDMHRGSVDVALHAEGLAISTRTAQRPMLRAAVKSMALMSAPVASTGEGSAKPAEYGGITQLATEYSETTHHARPVSVGVTVSVPVSRRVAVTTGVVYTSASTDFISSAAGIEVTEQQRLHYIGVPLGVKCDILNIGQLRAYVTGSGQADFNVAARLTAGGATKNAKKDRPQLSVGAAAGVQYDVVHHFGIYAEPGVKYYIDNAGSVSTIFKDKPWAFSLQLGVRIGF